MRVPAKKQKISAVKQRMLTSAIGYLRFKGYHDIKAQINNFGNPQAVFLKASDAGFVPDLIANRDFGTYIFEIFADKDEESASYLKRWDTYLSYAERKNGKFYLIAYSDDVEDLNERASSLSPTPGIIQIRK
jgi:hypothetical protein